MWPTPGRLPRKPISGRSRPSTTSISGWATPNTPCTTGGRPSAFAPSPTRASRQGTGASPRTFSNRARSGMSSPPPTPPPPPPIHPYGEVLHVLVDRGDYRGPFAPGYRPLEQAAEPAGLVAIDHVVGNVQFGKMNHWVRFYHEVMRFRQLIHFDDQDIG